MNQESSSSRSLRSTALLAICAVTLVVCIVYDPSQAFDASLQGLTVWWRIIFPALLPFFMLSEMLIASGFVHFLGTLLDPLFRGMLRIPGIGGFILPLGMTAGFPSAADASVKLYQDRQITAGEASRMAALAHYANPMFIVIVIGVGFLHTPALGILIAAIHLLAGIAGGVTLSFITKKRGAASSPTHTSHTNDHSSLLKRALHNMIEARNRDGRSFGKLLGDTVSSSVQRLMTIGGYILIFAVIIQIISRALPEHYPGFVLPSIIEVHLGAFATTQSSWNSPVLLTATIGALLGWSGLCSYFQVRALLKPAGLGSREFLLSRVLHGSYAYVFTLLLWQPLTYLFPHTLPAFTEMNLKLGDVTGDPLPSGYSLIELAGWQALIFFIMIFGLMICAWIWRLAFARKRRIQ